MPETSKLEKLNWELEKSEKKLRKAINDEKALQHQLKQLTRCSLPSKTQKSDTQNTKNRSDLSDLRKPERFFLCNIIF